MGRLRAFLVVLCFLIIPVEATILAIQNKSPKPKYPFVLPVVPDTGIVFFSLQAKAREVSRERERLIQEMADKEREWQQYRERTLMQIGRLEGILQTLGVLPYDSLKAVK